MHGAFKLRGYELLEALGSSIPIKRSLNPKSHPSLTSEPLPSIRMGSLVRGLGFRSPGRNIEVGIVPTRLVDPKTLKPNHEDAHLRV